MIPGEYLLKDDDIIANAGSDALTLEVVNTGDRPVQVGSHYHFFEANSVLSFSREAAYGKRLDIPSGTAVRFEPGEAKEISLIDIGGRRYIAGFSNLVDGIADEMRKQEAVNRMIKKGFKNQAP